jgi:hypothetical protein
MDHPINSTEILAHDVHADLHNLKEDVEHPVNETARNYMQQDHIVLANSSQT